MNAAFLANVDLVRRFCDASYVPVSARRLADQLGRDSSNTVRALTLLERDGLITDRGTPQATDKARRWLAAFDHAQSDDAHGVRTAPAPGVIAVAHADLRPNPLNPRKHFVEVDIAELADAIAEVGLLQNLTTSPPGEDGKRMILAGERRWRAIGMLIADDRWPRDRLIPLRERPESVADALLVAMIENGQRADITELEDADALALFADETKLSARQIAAKIGRNERLVQQRIRVARQATPQWRLRFEENSCTWEELRRSVEEAKPAVAAPPPPPAAGAELLRLKDALSEGAARAESAQPPATRPAADDGYTHLDQLSPREQLILLECADKILRHQAIEGGLYHAPAGASWLDARVQPLVNARLLAFAQLSFSTTARTWHVQLAPAGWDLLDAVLHDGALCVPEPMLEAAREAGGQAAWPADRGYATAWLNTDALPAPAALPDEPDHLGEAVAALIAHPQSHLDLAAVRRLLQQCGVNGALRLAESDPDDSYAAQLVDEAGGLLAIIDPDEGLEPRQAQALARLIAFAVNWASGAFPLEDQDRSAA